MEVIFIIVLLSALGIGGAMVVGAAAGFFIRKPSQKLGDAVMAFAGGVMLAAAVLGLIIPSVEAGGENGIWVTVAGILAGTLFITLLDHAAPHLRRFTGVENAEGERGRALDRAVLFVLAIAVHNLPEGIAAGVGFGGGTAAALAVAGSIALHNIPVGMLLIASMLSAGMSAGQSFVVALLTGLVEVVGVLIGYSAVSLAAAILPFALAFAGGTMLCVVCGEMIPSAHSHGESHLATCAQVLGFIAMLLLEHFLEG